MTTISTADDLIEVLKSDDKVRSAVRRELLTEELLALPERFDKMLETQTEMLETQTEMLKTQTAMLEDIKGIREEQKALREEQTSLRKTTNSLLKTQTAILNDISALRKTHKDDREEDIQTMHRFRGNYAASAAAKRRARIAKHFARLWQMRQIKCEVLSPDDVDALTDEKFDALTKAGFTDDDVNQVSEADLVIGVKRRREAKPEFYVVAEASYTGDKSDVDRSIVRAKIVAAATGLDAYAIVASVRLDSAIESRVVDDAEEYLNSDRGSVAFWYEIDEEDLEPPSPR